MTANNVVSGIQLRPKVVVFRLISGKSNIWIKEIIWTKSINYRCSRRGSRKVVKPTKLNMLSIWRVDSIPKSLNSRPFTWSNKWLRIFQTSFVRSFRLLNFRLFFRSLDRKSVV